MKVRLGTKLCIRCGYQLTGLTSNTCPECGHSFTPHHRGTYYTVSNNWDPRLKTVMKLGFIPLGIFVMMFQALGIVYWELLETACWLAAAFVISCTIHGYFLTFHYCYKSRQPRWLKFRRSLLMVLLLAANYLVIWGIAYITDSIDY